MSAQFPPSLGFFLMGTFSEERIDTTVTDANDLGVQERRQRLTTNKLKFIGTYRLSDAQKVTFDQFHDVTVKTVLPFTWVHPVSKATHLVTFVEMPVSSQVFKGVWDISVELLEQ